MNVHTRLAAAQSEDSRKFSVCPIGPRRSNDVSSRSLRPRNGTHEGHPEAWRQEGDIDPRSRSPTGHALTRRAATAVCWADQECPGDRMRLLLATMSHETNTF